MQNFVSTWHLYIIQTKRNIALDSEQKDILDLIIEMKFMFCNCSHHIASEHLLPPPCIKTTIGAQISGVQVVWKRQGGRLVN